MRGYFVKKILSFAVLCMSLPALAEQVFFDFNGKLYPAEFVENDATKALIKRVPLMMSFEDFGKSERISYLKYPLPMTKEKIDYVPKKGDIAYWPPRRNLTVFLTDPAYKADLIPIGRVSDETLEMIRTSQSWVMNLVREKK